jgi:hypothetical protein
MNASLRFYPQSLLIQCGMISLGLLTFACTSSPVKNKAADTVKDHEVKKPMVKKPPSSFEDTLTIENQSAVFYSPDSVQLNKIKAAYEKNAYETQTHDCYYMMQNARNVIKEHWPRLHVIEVSKTRYLLFVKKDKSKICVDLNTKNEICGLFLFDPKKNPELIDMPNVATYLGFYFEK